MKYKLPDVVSGYELDHDEKWFSVVVPVATTNLVKNPSVEIDSTGYAGVSAVVARSASYQSRGTYSISVTPTANVLSGVYYGTVVLAAGLNTFSVDVRGTYGIKYSIYFADTNGVKLGPKTIFKGNGQWKRVSVTFQETQGASRRVYVVQEPCNSVKVFYVDGLQVEALGYPTTYCDGDMVGYTRGKKEYGWSGTVHASTSWRLATTRSGGKEVKLKDIGFNLTGVTGLGMNPVQSVSLAMNDGSEFYQNTLNLPREFSLIGSIFGRDFKALMKIRKELVSCLCADIVSDPQPILMRFVYVKNGEEVSETLDILCNYIGGFDGNITGLNQEKLVLQFKMHNPFMINSLETSKEIGYSTIISDVNYLLQRDALGTWKKFGTGPNGYVEWVTSKNGVLYIGGEFTSVDGVAASGIAYYDDSGWHAMGVGIGSSVHCILVGADGTVYAAGDFTTLGDNTPCNYFAKWDGVSWTQVGDGLSYPCYSMAMGLDGSIYAAEHSVAFANTMKWDGSTLTAVGDLTSYGVYDIAVDRNGDLYASSEMTPGLLKYNTTTGVWDRLLGGRPAGIAAGRVCVTPNNKIYTGAMGFVNSKSSHIYHYNGSVYTDIGYVADPTQCYIENLVPDKNGLLYVVGRFSSVSGFPLPDSISFWNGSSWQPLEINLPATSQVWSIDFDDNNVMTIAFDQTGDVSAPDPLKINHGTVLAYPKFTIMGPGTLVNIKNYTTGDVICFNNLVIKVGEKIVVDLNPTKPCMISNFRGDITNFITEFSSIDFKLVSGDNYITVYINGTTDANTKSLISWKNRYKNIEGALYD